MGDEYLSLQCFFGLNKLLLISDGLFHFLVSGGRPVLCATL